jgi:hypothetical protein
LILRFHVNRDGIFNCSCKSTGIQGGRFSFLQSDAIESSCPVYFDFYDLLHHLIVEAAMRNRIALAGILCLVSGILFAQKMTVKDSDANVLMEVNDEGTVGSITIEDATEAPKLTTNKLYNVGGGSAVGWIETDPLFEIGRGSSITPRNVVTVLKNGNVGIGTATPGYLLQMESSGGGYYNELTHAWVDGSTRAIKQDIRPNSMDLREVLDQVSVVNYRYKAEVKENPDAPYHIGFIADDTPELLSGTKHDGMQMNDCIGLLLAVVQEQQKAVEEQQRRIEDLESEIKAMKR